MVASNQNFLDPCVNSGLSFHISGTNYSYLIGFKAPAQSFTKIENSQVRNNFITDGLEIEEVQQIWLVHARTKEYYQKLSFFH
jgi:hypothetical protein